MLRIGLDLDGVVADWSGHIRKVLVKEFGYTPAELKIGEESPEWYFIPHVISKDHWNWVWNTWARNNGFADLPPMPEAAELVHGLKQFGELCIVTSRPRSAWFDTLFWIDNHHVGPPKEIHFYENGLDKKEADCDIYIEDAPHYANELVQSGYPVCVPARPYNDVPAYSDIKGLRFDTAKDILNYFEVNYAKPDDHRVPV